MRLPMRPARSFRYLWMGYAILSEASRRLLTLQADRYLGDISPLLPHQASPVQMEKNLTWRRSSPIINFGISFFNVLGVGNRI